MTIYNKLIRDRIPQIIKDDGKTAVIEILAKEDYINSLDNKLQEELTEYQESKSLEELADMLEVMYAIVIERGYSIEALEQTRKDKLNKRGGFKERILLKKVIE